MEQSPTNTPASLPVVRLLPKSKPQAIRHGFPWAFANELVMDRRTKGITPGDLVVLEDADRRPLGLGTMNPLSKIAIRMLDFDTDVDVNEAWFVAKLTRALQHRDALYDEPFYRLVHAEADGLPGIIIDRFGDVAVIQPNAAYAERMLEPLVAALIAVTGVTTVIKNGTGRARSLEGLEENMAVAHGQTPSGPVPVKMNGATYMADVMGGQKTGLFLDQRPNHAFAASLANGGRLLDVFSHVGGFSLAALANGAASAVAVDGSAPACSCSHAADLKRFRDASARGIGRGGRRSQLVYTGSAGPDHPLLPQLAESGYLKALAFRL